MNCFNLKTKLFLLLLFSVIISTAHSTTYIVAGSGGDFQKIQDALNAAGPSDSILVQEKQSPYFEKLQFPKNGTASGGHITLMAFPGHSPVVDGTGVNGSNMVLIDRKNYIRVIGFELQNNLNVNDGSGIRIIGYGSNIELLHNTIHDMRGKHAMGITVYGTQADPITELRIENNLIYDCEPANSEALTLNGNVSNFVVSYNVVRDVNNIGIDFIGGETSINSNPDLVARDGLCSWNEVYNANSIAGGGYAGGIYVDGGRNIIIENNIVTGSDIGLTIGAENPGIVTENIIVRNNRIYQNEKAGIHFGGYEESRGRVKNCKFLNNTCWRNDILHAGWGELWIEYSEDNEIKNNIFWCNNQNILIQSAYGNVNNHLDYNLWFTDGSANNAKFNWDGEHFTGFSSFKSGTGLSSNGQFADPRFVNPDQADFHIVDNSPAMNAGDPQFESGRTEVDIDNEPRVKNFLVDIGADEGETEITASAPSIVKNVRIGAK